MLKIGLVGIDTSHPLGFGEEMEKNKLNMKYHWVYNDGFREEDEVEWFVKRFALEGKAKTIEEMAKKVDIGFVQSCNWEKHIEQALPFISENKPVFLDKPLVGSMKDIKALEELSEKGAVILGSSSLRYAKEIQEFISIPVEERGEIVSMFGTGGVDEFNYGIHIVEAFSELAKSTGINCCYIGKGEQGGESCEMYSVEFENGVRGVYYTYLNRWHPFHITIMTTKTTYTLKIDSSKIYLALLEQIEAWFHGDKDKIAPINTLVNCTKIMLCGKKSRDEKNGAVVTVEDLTLSDGFDGYQFEKEYGAKAGKLYCD